MFPAHTDRGELFYKTEPDFMPVIQDPNPPDSTAAPE
jgi:hypothetical protein